ncbi:MAG TPA: hypothetical protein VF739_04155 [Ktedonobacterales bacterium]
MIARITQAQADEAAASAASFWPTFGRKWPWTRAPELAPIYQRAGKLTVALLRAFPAIQWSNQARWYRRDVRDTPAIIALTPDALRAEVGALAATPGATEGKQVVSLLYLPEKDAPPDAGMADSSAEPPVARTLLASTTLDAPYYTAQLAHELLNCFCHTSWDGQIIRSGLREGAAGTALGAEPGAALNDLLLDAMLVHFLPVAGDVRAEDLFDGAQGPYWRIARTFSARLRGVPALPALFSGELAALARFQQGLALALDLADAARELDAQVASHDWAALRRTLGDDE